MKQQDSARRKIDYVHWPVNRMLMGLFKEFFKTSSK